MSITDFEFLPYPASMLILTGLSFATLLYVTYPKDFNKLPQQITSQATAIGASASSLGSTISQSANKIITPVAQAIMTQPIPATAPVAAPVAAAAPVQAVPAENNGIVSGISNTLSRI